MVALAMEFVATWTVLLSRRREIARAVTAVPRFALAGAALVLALTSATLSQDPATYAAELAVATILQLTHLGATVLLALSLSPATVAMVRRAADRLLGPEDAEAAPTPAGPDRFVWTLAALVFATAFALAVWSYQRHPHVPDEVVYLIQARYLAEGRLSLPVPPVVDAFSVDLMMYEATRWFSPVPPGWPFILALGTAVGATWLVNPLLGGLNVVLAHTVLREVYPRRTARLATLLFACSPWGLFMAMNLMTHTATLTMALLATASVARLRRGGHLGWGILGGIGIGVVGLIRPLEGIVVALLLGFWSLGARGRRWALAPSAVLTLSTIATGALVFPYNAHLTGSARTFPIMAYTDAVYGPGTNALGFGSNRGLGWPGLDPLPGHGLPDVLINANFNLFQTSTELHGWATGSLVGILLLLLLGKLRRTDWQMLAVIASVAGIHSFYYFSGGPDFGARYWFLVIVPCIALSARGLERLGARLGGEAPGRVLAGTGVLVLLTLLLLVPWRAVDKYRHYRRMRPEARQLASDPALQGGILLVRGVRHPDFASAVVYNPLTLEGREPVFAWDRGASTRRELVTAFPERTFYVVDGPTRTGDGYLLVAGPLTGAQLLARGDTVPGAP
jgi:4-amino-4-deoxy-L-arabinose transferase-like glycosyltransferase